MLILGETAHMHLWFIPGHPPALTGQDRGSVHWGQDVDCGGRSCNILRDRIHEYLSPLLLHIWHWTSQFYCTVCLLQKAHSTADLPHCRWLLLCLHTRKNPTRRCTGRRTDCRCHCIDKGHCPGVKSLCMSPYLGPATPPGPEVASCLAMSTLNFVVHVYQLPCQHNQSVDHSVDILCEFLTLWNFNLRLLRLIMLCW